MSERDPVGVIVAHGAMARGLIDAVRRIAGDAADLLLAISNDGKGPDQLRDELEAAVGSRPALIFVDLLSGSCCMAALTTCRGCGDRAVVTGVNLPMLLDFALQPNRPLDELVHRAIQKGRDAIDHPALS